jgi:hypothetical protein
VRFALLALVVAAAACGDDALRPVPLDGYGEAAQVALCGWAVRCRHVPDVATCRRLLDPKAYDLGRAQASMTAGRLRYDPAAAARCLDAGRTALCPARPFAGDACLGVFVGLVAVGGACTTSADCAGGGACDAPSCPGGCCVGTCLAPSGATPPLQVAVGQPCQQHEDCVDDAYCEADHTCHAMPDAAGEHCLYGCTTGDLHCDPATETCVPFARLGEACDGAAPPCSGTYAFCDGAVCQPRPGAGEPCDEHRTCVAGGRCLGGVCTPRGTAGGPCASDDDCDYACDRAAGVCVAAAACLMPG